MKGIVIYESLTGNTRSVAHRIADQLSEAGVDTIACSIKQIDLQQLSDADLVVIGSWVDGLFFVGQKPAGVRRLMNLPVIDGKKTAVYLTYAIDKGNSLQVLSDMIERRGGEVVGGMAIKRNNLESGADEFVDRLLGVLESA